MKKSTTSFDRLVELHYAAVYKIAAALIPDPEKAAALTRRAFSHARNVFRGGGLGRTREALVKILFLEFAAVTLRSATA